VWGHERNEFAPNLLQAATAAASEGQAAQGGSAAQLAAAEAAAQRNASEVQRLRGQLSQLQRMMTHDDAASAGGAGASSAARFNRTSIADISDAQVGRNGVGWVVLKGSQSFDSCLRLAAGRPHSGRCRFLHTTCYLPCPIVVVPAFALPCPPSHAPPLATLPACLPGSSPRADHGGEGAG
jgi:hypothetical protein